MKVVWTNQARSEFYSIVAFIALESPACAARIRAQILHSISFLEAWPEIGRRGRRGRRELVVPHSPYIVIFKFDGVEVVVLRVLHASRKRRQND